MNIVFRPALRSDVADVVALLADDDLGAKRETGALAPYLAAFDAMTGEGANFLIIGENGGQIVATYQLIFISGLSLRATRRAQMESLRVRSDLRGQGAGHMMMDDAEQRARAAGCGLIQLTTNKERDRAQAFYVRAGFTPSHVGYKRVLD